MDDPISWPQRSLADNFRNAKNSGMKLVPGVCFCLVVMLAANYLSDSYGGTPVLAALLLGMAFNNISKYSEFASGLDFCASRLMRAGVALLGAGITFEQISLLGYKPFVVVGMVVVFTLAFGVLFGRILKVDVVKSIISAGAVAICGASAALAVSSVLPTSKSTERHLLCTLVGVTGFSTLAMLIYPRLITYFGLSEEHMGMFLGAAIHDVAQVMGAGQMLSVSVAELATYTKMLRVSMLVPVVTILIVLFSSGKATGKRIAAVPPFLVAFVLFVVIANLNLIPQSVVGVMSNTSQFFLWTAMAALGTKTNLLDMWTVGRKSLFLLLVNTLFVAALAMIVILY